MASMNPRRSNSERLGVRGARQRGAALLEAVVVAAACLAVLGLGLVVHGREVARLERERERRIGAWQRALGGCVEGDSIAGLAQAALQGSTAAAAERLARGVLGPDGEARGLARAPCNPPRAPGAAEWARTETDLERQLLPALH